MRYILLGLALVTLTACGGSKDNGADAVTGPTTTITQSCLRTIGDTTVTVTNNCPTDNSSRTVTPGGQELQ